MEDRRKLKAASFSVAVNLFLILLKASVAFMSGSLAIFAELIHSVFDLMASVFAYLGIKKAEQPPDHTHHFGHEKFENLSSLAQTLLIVVTSLLIMYEAFGRLFKPVEVEATELGILVMLVTIAVDYFLSKYLHGASKEYASCALEADAYHFTTDLWGAASVIVGLVFVYLGFPVFDSLAAISVALLMLYISYRLGSKALHVLLDKSPSREFLDEIGKLIESTPRVCSYHKLRARQAGNRVLVEVHIQVDPDMAVRESHNVSHQVKESILRGLPEVKEVTVHIEPGD